MYSLHQHAYGQYAAADLAASRLAAERHRHLTAATAARKQRNVARREARAQRRSRSVAVA
jgi:hypothetical protein